MIKYYIKFNNKCVNQVVDGLFITGHYPRYYSLLECRKIVCNHKRMFAGQKQFSFSYKIYTERFQ